MKRAKSTKPFVIVKQSEWKNMPQKTKLALSEMCKAAIKQFGK